MTSYIIPVAYDYHYAPAAIRSIYSIADEIVIGVDRDRLTWSGKPFELDLEAFKAAVASFDVRGIVRIIEDDFHPEDHPMKNEVRERNLLSAQCQRGNWLVQLDADERALNPRDFRDFLARQDGATDVAAEFVTVFKVIGKKCLVTARPWEWCPLATTVVGGYKNGRNTGRPLVLSGLKLLHFSWGRTRAELVQKVTNWGHARDFDTGKFLEFWDGVDLTNYTQWKNFHPLHGPLWPGLTVVDLPPACS